MRYDLFMHSKQPAARPANTTGDDTRQLDSFTVRERIILSHFFAMILGILALSGWSAILLATGDTESGGPIGMAVRYLFSIL